MQFGGNRMPPELFLQTIMSLNSLQDILNFCATQPSSSKLCKSYRQNIAKRLLDIYQVNYHDPTNYIYIVNKSPQTEYFNQGVWNYTRLFKLYYRHFNDRWIYCKGLSITSIPIYPNMIHLRASNNNLTHPCTT